MTAETYPTDNSGNTASLSYAFDSMGRLNTMTDVLSGVTLITGASYGPANEMLSLTGGAYNGAWGSETHTYNSLKQLTQLSSNGLSIQYNYPSTGNNGKIASQTDLVSGETVTYSYDALNRLATAATQSNISVPWGQSFTYDGFGNLTNVGVTQGSTPTLTASYDGNNHAGGEDANGNPSSIPAPAYGTNVPATYDVENRLVSGGARYSYAPGNKRVWRGVGGWNSDTGQWSPTDEVTFWSVSGQKLATYQLTTSLGVGPPSPSQPAFYATQTATNYYFGSKLIKDNNGWVYSDRLGSIGKFYPYGIERPSPPPPNGTEKFTGYLRDAETGNDYAVNRYMSPGMARFITPDRGMGGARPGDPGTWNKYAYTGGDPINRVDRNGADYEDCDAGDCVLTWTSVGVGYEEQESLFEQDPNSPCYGTDPSSPACDEFLGSMFPSMFQPQVGAPIQAQGTPQGNVIVQNLNKTGPFENVIWNDLSFMQAAFNANIDPGCESWLTGVVGLISSLLGSTGMTQDSLIANGVFSNPSVNAFSNTNGSNVPPGYASLVVNDNGAFFNSSASTGVGVNIAAGTFGAQVFILLHELGHDAGVLVDDTSGTQAQNQANQGINNAAVLSNCGSLLTWASK